MHRIPRPFVVSEPEAHTFGRHQIGLIDDDARRDVVGFGNDEEAIEHARMRFRIGRREYDQHLIDIGGDDTLTIATARSATRKLRATRQNAGDRPVRAIAILLDVHLITDGEFERRPFGGVGAIIAFVGTGFHARACPAAVAISARLLAFRIVEALEPSAQCGVDHHAITAAHTPDAAGSTEHNAEAVSRRRYRFSHATRRQDPFRRASHRTSGGPVLAPTRRCAVQESHAPVAT